MAGPLDANRLQRQFNRDLGNQRGGLAGIPALSFRSMGMIDVTGAEIPILAKATPDVIGSFDAPNTEAGLAPTWDGPTMIIYYDVADIINLPAADLYAGRRCVVYNAGTFIITVDLADSTDQIIRDGTVQAAGVGITLSTGIGNYVELISDGNQYWSTLSSRGTLLQIT